MTMLQMRDVDKEYIKLEKKKPNQKINQFVLMVSKI